MPDAWHAEAAAKLQSKMKDLNLTPAILDTFANLTLKPQELMVLRQGKFFFLQPSRFYLVRSSTYYLITYIFLFRCFKTD